MNQIPTLKQLRYLVAVADHNSFRRAAEVCFVTQPALSEQIQQLEGLIGVQLVERTQRKVMLTPSGEIFARSARQVLRNMEDMVDLAQQSKEPFSAPLRLGVIPTIAPYLLPRILRKIRKVYPQLKLYLREEQTARLLSQLREGKLDALLLALPIDGNDLESLLLYREEFVLLSVKDKSQAREENLREQDIAGERVLLLEEGHCLRDQALKVCHTAGARESQDFRASSLNTLVQMVANGLGITLLPELALDIEVQKSDNLAVTRFMQPAPSRDIGLVWRRQSARREEFMKLVEAIKKYVPLRRESP